MIKVRKWNRLFPFHPLNGGDLWEKHEARKSPCLRLLLLGAGARLGVPMPERADLPGRSARHLRGGPRCHERRLRLVPPWESEQQKRRLMRLGGASLQFSELLVCSVAFSLKSITGRVEMRTEVLRAGDRVRWGLRYKQMINDTSCWCERCGMSQGGNEPRRVPLKQTQKRSFPQSLRASKLSGFLVETSEDVVGCFLGQTQVG